MEWKTQTGAMEEFRPCNCEQPDLRECVPETDLAHFVMDAVE